MNRRYFTPFSDGKHFFSYVREREREITVKMITCNFFDMYFIFLLIKW